jgi:hypothetical protein
LMIVSNVVICFDFTGATDAATTAAGVGVVDVVVDFVAVGVMIV